MHRYLAMWGAWLMVLVLLVGCGVAPPAASCADLAAASPPTRSAGPVTIATDHSRYASTSVIHATVTNGLDVAIQAADHRASCSILGIQQEVGGVWQAPPQAIAGCPLGRPTMLVRIAPGASTTYVLHGGYLEAGTFPPGTYRLTLTYFAGRDVSATVYSAPLTIVACPAPTGSITPGASATVPAVRTGVLTPVSP
jgi:hypothetical protein